MKGIQHTKRRLLFLPLPAAFCLLLQIIIAYQAYHLHFVCSRERLSKMCIAVKRIRGGLMHSCLHKTGVNSPPPLKSTLPQNIHFDILAHS
jgi:hypothetical protein